MDRGGDFVGDWGPGIGDGGVTGRVGGSVGELGIGGAMGDMERGANHAAPQYGPQRNGFSCDQSFAISFSSLRMRRTAEETRFQSRRAMPAYIEVSASSRNSFRSARVVDQIFRAASTSS